MDEPITAAEANRSFSRLLRGVREGRSYVVTSHGRPVARLGPPDEADGLTRQMRRVARHSLFERLEQQPALDFRCLEQGRGARALIVAVDTNVLAYAEGIGDAKRQATARAMMQALPGDAVVIPLQALSELFSVLLGRGWGIRAVREAIAAWHRSYPIAATTEGAMVAAFDLAADHRLNIWDSVTMSVAAESGCRLLLSEDLQHGFTWRGVTVANPFAAEQHPLLASLLEMAGAEE